MLNLRIADKAEVREEHLHHLNSGTQRKSGRRAHSIIERTYRIKCDMLSILRRVRVPAAASKNWPSAVDVDGYTLLKGRVKDEDGEWCTLGDWDDSNKNRFSLNRDESSDQADDEDESAEIESEEEGESEEENESEG